MLRLGLIVMAALALLAVRDWWRAATRRLR